MNMKIQLLSNCFRNICSNCGKKLKKGMLHIYFLCNEYVIKHVAIFKYSN